MEGLTNIFPCPFLYSENLKPLIVQWEAKAAPAKDGSSSPRKEGVRGRRGEGREGRKERRRGEG